MPNTIIGRTQQEIQIVEIEARRMEMLRPDVSLQDKCIEDWTQLSQVGMSCEEAGNILQGVSLAARKLFRGRALLLENVVMGRLFINSFLQNNEYCPFACNYHEDQFSQSLPEVVTVKNLYNQKEISFSNSTIHNLRRHGFSAGLDLKEMFSVLDLPRLDGCLKVVDEICEKKWEFSFGVSLNDADHEKMEEEKMKQMARQAYQIDEFATAYVFDQAAPFVSNQSSYAEKLQSYSQMFDWSQEQLQETMDARAQLPFWFLNQAGFSAEGSGTRCRIFNHQRDFRKISCSKIGGDSIDNRFIASDTQSYYNLSRKVFKSVNEESLEKFIDYYRYPPALKSSKEASLLTDV